MEYRGLIAGLGNPGRQYEGTRHNLGFALVDFVLRAAEQDGRVESLSGSKFRCELWRCTLGREKGWWLAAKPQTYMNCSGESVQPLLAWHKLTPGHLLVVHDELDIAPGHMRFKFGGGNAGHNGLQSITQHLGTPDFYRLRLGIGRPPHKGDVTHWVLGRPQSDEARLQEESLPDALKTLLIFAADGVKAAAAHANSVKVLQEKVAS